MRRHQRATSTTAAQAYHDIAACWRPDRFGLPRFEGEIFSGVNFRMSELPGAVALAQFGKLDGLLVARMRAQQEPDQGAPPGLKGLDFRDLTDEAGDTAICLIFFLPEAGQVEEFVKALQAEGVEAGGIYNKGVPDWHIYPHWKMLMEKMMPAKKGCPFNCPLCGPAPEYRYTATVPEHPRVARPAPCTSTSRRSSPTRTATRSPRASARSPRCCC